MIQYGIKNMCRMIAILGKFPVNIKIHSIFYQRNEKCRENINFIINYYECKIYKSF